MELEAETWWFCSTHEYSKTTKFQLQTPSLNTPTKFFITSQCFFIDWCKKIATKKIKNFQGFSLVCLSIMINKLLKKVSVRVAPVGGSLGPLKIALLPHNLRLESGAGVFADCPWIELKTTRVGPPGSRRHFCKIFYFSPQTHKNINYFSRQNRELTDCIEQRWLSIFKLISTLT